MIPAAAPVVVIISPAAALWSVVLVTSVVIPALVVTTCSVSDLVVVVLAGLAHESHSVLDFLDGGLRLLANSIVPLALQARVSFILQQTLVVGHLCLAFDLLHFAFDFERVAELHQTLADVIELTDLCWRRNLQRTELLHVGVVEVDAVLVLVVEGGRAVAVALLLTLDLLECVQRVAILALRLCLRNFDFTLLNGIREACFTSLFRLVVGVGGIIGLLGALVLALGPLFILRAEVDELLAQVDIVLVWVLIEFLKLLHLPLTLFLFLLTTALLLLGLVLVILLFALLSKLLACLHALAAFLVVLGLALGLLDDHLLRLRDPLDVLDKALLDLVVAHATVEVLFDLPLFAD